MLRSIRRRALPSTALGAVLGVLGILAGCAPAGDPPAAGPVTVRALMSHDPPSLSLLGKMDRNSEILAVQLTDSLVQYDERMELQPRLARAWSYSDERRTLTFDLRPGVRWHDGRELTAEDVVFSVAQARDPAVENRSFGPLFAGLESLEALGPLTVRARYEVASPGALEAWRLPILPRHLAESGAALIAGEYARHPIGCGPFRFVRWRPGEEIVLEANDDYWDGRPAIDRLVLRIFPEQRTGFQSLLAGELDTMTVTPDLWLRAREPDVAERLDSLLYYRLNVWQIAWNVDGSNPFFNDAGVRRAMLLALDRETFIRTVLHGLARPGVTTYHPDLSWTDPTLAPLPYDPGEARRLLEAAGWTAGDGDGVRSRAGRPFRFTLRIHSSTQAVNDQMAAWLQQAWRDVGVQADIEKLEWREFRERRDAREFEAAMAGIGFTSNPDQFELYHSTQRAAGFNFSGLADAQVDRLLEAGRTTWDEAERRRVYIELQRRLHELQPVACLLYFATPVLHDRRLRGLVPSPLDHWRHTRGPRVWHWQAGGAGD